MQKKGQLYQYLLLLFILPLVLHCAVPQWKIYEKDGHVYGIIEGNWRGQWWDYYLRGLSYSQGQYWEEAISDFESAYKLRFKDQRRVRTHGLHILDEYFPHREKGIVYYKINRYQEAISELELSLEHFESAKAKYFLNLAREASLKQSGLDIHPPEIFVSSPKDIYTNQCEITLEGYVTDDQFAREIVINGENVSVELALPHLEFKKILALCKGKNEIILKAADLVGRHSEKAFEIVCDRDAPMIYIDEIEPLHEGHGYFIKGYVDDDIGVKLFTFNGQNVALEKGDRGLFSVEIIAYSREKVDFYIEDKLHNSTSGEIKLTHGAQCENKLAYLSRDLSQIIGQKRDAAAEDSIPPVITCKNLPKAMRVNWDELYIEGEVRDEEKVASLKINNSPLLTRASSRVFFNYHIRLNEGINKITISAMDNNGNMSKEQIEVYREIESIYKVGSRLSLALIPFKYIGQRDELKNLIYDQLIQVFIEQRRFQFVDREKISSLLSKMESEECSSMELGRLVSAEGVIVGSAYFYDDYLEVIARLIDTETSVVLDSEDVFGEVEHLSDVMLLLQGLALKFKQALPLTEGEVTAMANGDIQLDLTSGCGIKEHMKVIFYKVEKKGSMDSPIIIGEGRVTDVYDDCSQAKLTEQRDDMLSVDLKDRVITK
ncbi:MAG: hypothetical protein ACMUJM_00205 [bacterium]